MNPRRRSIIVGVTAIVAAVVVWFGRKSVLTDLDRQRWAAAHPTESPPFSVARAGHWEWTYPRTASLQQGEAQCRLILSRHADVPFEHYERTGMPLRLRVSAHQRDTSGRRQVIENLFPVDSPDAGSSFAVSGYSAAEVEHTVGTLRLDPSAGTVFTVDVEVPDPALAPAQPRLRVSGAYDYAALEHGGVLLLGRDALAASIGIALLRAGAVSLRRASRW